MFERLKTALLLRGAWKQVDLAKFKSVKFWAALAANALVAAAAIFLEIDLDPELAAQIICVITGGYLASQAMADWRKNAIDKVRGNLASRKLLVSFLSSVLIGALTQAGLDPETAAKLIGLITTLWLPAQGAADFGKEKELAAEAKLYAAAQRLRSDSLTGVTYTVRDEGVLEGDPVSGEH